MTAPPKRRRFRFGLRTMFVVVTLAALAVGQWQRAQRLRRCADGNRMLAVTFTRKLYEGETDKARQKEVVEYHRAMVEKCQKAIWQPWIELQPDPVYPHLSLP